MGMKQMSSVAKRRVSGWRWGFAMFGWELWESEVVEKEGKVASSELGKSSKSWTPISWPTSRLPNWNFTTCKTEEDSLFFFYSEFSLTSEETRLKTRRLLISSNLFPFFLQPSSQATFGDKWHPQSHSKCGGIDIKRHSSDSLHSLLLWRSVLSTLETLLRLFLQFIQRTLRSSLSSTMIKTSGCQIDLIYYNRSQSIFPSSSKLRVLRIITTNFIQLKSGLKSFTCWSTRSLVFISGDRLF